MVRDVRMLHLRPGRTACNSLWKRDIDTVITGGTNISTDHDFTADLDRGHFLSRTSNYKSFNDAADSYYRGRGVATLILKRYEDAIAGKDPIHGLILSAYRNHSADAVRNPSRVHTTEHRRQSSTNCCTIRERPVRSDLHEMHGMGTQAGDAGEMRFVLDVFAPKPRLPIGSNDQALYLGSAKLNTGHGEAASGASTLTKVLLI
jgi:acyl transferase domain-containing protein